MSESPTAGQPRLSVSMFRAAGDIDDMGSCAGKTAQAVEAAPSEIGRSGTLRAHSSVRKSGVDYDAVCCRLFLNSRFVRVHLGVLCGD